MQRVAYRFTKPKEQLKWMEDEGTQVIATGYQAHSSLLRIFGQWLIFPTCKKQRLWRGDVDLILGNEWMLQNINGQSSGEKYRRTKADTLFSNVIFGIVRPFRYLHAALGKKVPFTFGCIQYSANLSLFTFGFFIYTKWAFLDITSSRLHFQLSLPLILDIPIFPERFPNKNQLQESWKLKFQKNE